MASFGKSIPTKVRTEMVHILIKPARPEPDRERPTWNGERAGKIKIGAVTDLQLVTETDAAAHFAWEGSMNDFGNILTSNKGDEEQAKSSFRKKRDETWFVAESNLR